MFDQKKHKQYMEDINEFLNYELCGDSCDDNNVTLDISLGKKGNLFCNDCSISMVTICLGSQELMNEVNDLLKDILNKDFTMNLLVDEWANNSCH